VIETFLRREIDVGSFSSASYAIGSFSGIDQEGALGQAVAVPLRLRAKFDTIYDCASLTKPLITTTLALQELALDQRIHGYTVRELLTHTSGLRAWMPLYAYDDPIAALLEHGPEYARGTRVVYSDLNFILLWTAIEDYASKARERIFAPLGLIDAMFNPPPALRPRVAATEWGQRFEAKLANRTDLPPREGLIWGQTHDGNSFHAGGTAGNAGLFATARAVFRLAQGWVNGELLPPDVVADATRNHTEGLDDARGLAWQLPTGSAATSMLSPRAFGHTGFTGTSLWIDPDRDRIMVLLTNRVHPCAAPVAMQQIRGEFHRLALRDAVEIRLATPADAAAISEVLRAAFAEHVPQYTAAAMDVTVLDAQRVAARMAEGPVWVVVERGAIVGTAAAVGREGGLYVRGMGVLPSARGKRIGERLLHTIERHARENSVRRMFLSTTPYLLRAIQLYERVGFRRIDAGPHDLFGTPLFTMEKGTGRSPSP
jgi:CubicO group peptidase (beta-lactamase class C family)/N-acetylglutamate synthase-like GNAT family acetyltransferase